MSSVALDSRAVESDLAPEDLETYHAWLADVDAAPRGDDGEEEEEEPAIAAWIGATRKVHGVDPRDAIDVAWLIDEWRDLAARARRSDRAEDRIAARHAEGAARSLQAMKMTAAALMNAEWTDARRRRLARHRAEGSVRAVPLAARLDALASWYLHVDRAAADLLAWYLLTSADAVEEFRAETLEDLDRGHDRAREAVMEASPNPRPKPRGRGR